ncbi:MAG: hypothetical protein QM711_15905 [Micropruina sp.]|uniref:hypothetical protein n=1 Tax=Micropruina sp. TaxID=2737536 RepID=UPI0039E3C5AD
MRTSRTGRWLPALVVAGLVLAGCSTAAPATSAGSTPSVTATAGYPATVASCGRDFSYAKALPETRR